MLNSRKGGQMRQSNHIPPSSAAEGWRPTEPFRQIQIIIQEICSNSYFPDSAKVWKLGKGEIMKVLKFESESCDAETYGTQTWGNFSSQHF